VGFIVEKDLLMDIERPGFDPKISLYGPRQVIDSEQHALGLFKLSKPLYSLKLVPGGLHPPFTQIN
jgi:hypothetical protein